MCFAFLVLMWRWRLQKAFYTRESVGRSGCYGIECHAFLPSSKCCQSYDGERLIRALTLGDLEGMKPEWICNVLVDSWQWSSDVHVDRPNYELLTLTPSAIGRLDCAEPIWARKQVCSLRFCFLALRNMTMGTNTGLGPWTYITIFWQFGVFFKQIYSIYITMKCSISFVLYCKKLYFLSLKKISYLILPYPF